MRKFYRPFFAFEEPRKIYTECIELKYPTSVMLLYFYPSMVIIATCYTLLMVLLFVCVKTWPDFLDQCHKNKSKITEMCGEEL